MSRAAVGLVLIASLLVPGCYSSQSRFAGWTFGGLATVFGGAWLVAIDGQGCHRDDAGHCQGSIESRVDQVFAASLVTTTGVVIMVVTLFSAIGRRQPKP